jgi:hypothetical protein
MTALKWVLVVVGILFLIVGAGLVGALYWASTVESVPVTAADLEPGGSYPPAEKQALLDACNKQNADKPTDACACIADKAGTELSRFLRLILTATMNKNATELVALSKGLVGSGVPPEKAQGIEKEANARFEGLSQACGLGQ